MKDQIKHIWTKTEVAVVVVVGVVVLAGFMLMMQAASDFGDEHFPISRFINNK